MNLYNQLKKYEEENSLFYLSILLTTECVDVIKENKLCERYHEIIKFNDTCKNVRIKNLCQIYIDILDGILNSTEKLPDDIPLGNCYTDYVNLLLTKYKMFVHIKIYMGALWKHNNKLQIKFNYKKDINYSAYFNTYNNLIIMNLSKR